MQPREARFCCFRVATIICVMATADTGNPVLFAQQSSAAPSVSMGGTVTSATPERLVVKGAYSSPLVILLGKGAEVTKKSVSHDFSDVHAGDHVLMRGHMRGQWGPSGDFIADEVWVNLTSFDARVLSVHGNRYEVQVLRENGTWARTPRTVIIDSDTLGPGNQALPRSELAPERDARIIGTKLSDGTVLATHVIIYRSSLLSEPPR